MSQITSPDGSTPSLKDQFEADKKFLLESTQSYLSGNSGQPNITTLKYKEKSIREQIAAQVAAGDFGNAIEALEILREHKTNIARVKIESKDDNTSVVIRDARSAKNPPVRDTEAFEMQYLNTIRAAIEVAEIEFLSEKENVESLAKFNGLKEELGKKAQNYLNNFHENNTGNSQDEIFSKNNAELKDLILTLEAHGIRDARNKLNVAKEFQNFESSQANISTITKVNHKGNQYFVVESEVALRGLTESQKNEYEKIKSNQRPLPAWFTSMPKIEQQLTLKHIDAILSGKYVISTQLRQLVGMKNAFEKITAIKLPNAEFEVLHTSKHAGCLASFSHDESSKQGICNMNTRQAQEWIGNKKILHCNTFNSSTIGTKADRVIIDQTEKMLEQTPDVRLTNSAFNALRLSRLANNYDGSKKALEDIVSGLNKPELSNIKKYLDPKNSLSIYNDITNKHASIKHEIEKLKGAKKISEQEANVLKYAADLKYSINKAERTFNLDINNINADISVHLNKLNNAIAKVTPENSMLFNMLRQEEVLNMCASGKDRTGFAEHDQTVRVVAEKISDIHGAKVEAKDLDKHILAGGHTANQAGSISMGGNTIGCFGTKKDNIQSLPVHRMANLVGIIEVSASGNNLPKPTESEIDKAADKKEKQDRQPNYMKPTESTRNKNKANDISISLL